MIAASTFDAVVPGPDLYAVDEADQSGTAFVKSTSNRSLMLPRWGPEGGFEGKEIDLKAGDQQQISIGA